LHQWLVQMTATVSVTTTAAPTNSTTAINNTDSPVNHGTDLIAIVFES
jgi:hypothetical protein